MGQAASEISLENTIRESELKCRRDSSVSQSLLNVGVGEGQVEKLLLNIFLSGVFFGKYLGV